MSSLVVPGLLLAAVLILSGAAKLASPQAGSEAFRSLRLPEVLVRLRGPRLLPYAEFLLAALLVTAAGWAHVVVAAAALGLMLAYTGIVARALTFAEPVTCACFGTLGLGLVTRFTVVRNLVLSVVAALALADAIRQPRGITARLLDSGSVGWGWLAMVALTVLTIALIVHSTAPGGTPGVATSPAAGDDLDYVRQPIPFGRLRRPDGGHVSLRELASTAPRLLVFLNTGCGSCVTVMGMLPDFIAANPEVAVHPVFHAATDPERIPAWMETPLFDEDAAISQTFGVPTPAAVLLGADGLMAGGPVVGSTAVSDFLADIAGELAEVREQPVAAPEAPAPVASGAVLTGTVLDPDEPLPRSGSAAAVRGPNGELTFTIDLGGEPH